MISQADKDRFWSKVNIGTDDECWEWRGTTTNTGYGLFWLDSTMQLAHRISYRICVGYPFQNVLHKCDNPLCVNPKHLVLGSQPDNVTDMFQKNRQGDCRHFGPHHKNIDIQYLYGGDRMKDRVTLFPGMEKTIAEAVAKEVAKVKEESFIKIFELHVRALACHCECLGMNAENSLAVCRDQAPPYDDATYNTVMQKWNLINEKGDPTI